MPPPSSLGNWRTLGLTLCPKRKAAAPGAGMMRHTTLWGVSAFPRVQFTAGSSVQPLTGVIKLWSSWATKRFRKSVADYCTHNFIFKDKCSKSIIDICKNWVTRVMEPGRVPESLTLLQVNNSNWSYTFTAHFLQLPLRFILPGNQQLSTHTFPHQ